MQPEQSNATIVDKYFDMVQERIKDILIKDRKYSEDDAQKFNDLIFIQNDYETRKSIEKYVGDAVGDKVDIDEVANNLLNKYGQMVQTNNFDKDTVNDVPNQIEEGFRYLKKYNDFI